MHKLKTDDFLSFCVNKGYLCLDGDKHSLTDISTVKGVKFKYSKRFRLYLICPESLEII